MSIFGCKKTPFTQDKLPPRGQDGCWIPEPNRGTQISVVETSHFLLTLEDLVRSPYPTSLSLLPFSSLPSPPVSLAFLYTKGLGSPDVLNSTTTLTERNLWTLSRHKTLVRLSSCLFLSYRPTYSVLVSLDFQGSLITSKTPPETWRDPTSQVPSG